MDFLELKNKCLIIKLMICKIYVILCCWNLCILHAMCEYAWFWLWVFILHESMLSHACVIPLHFNDHTCACIIFNSTPSKEDYSIVIAMIWSMIRVNISIPISWIPILWLEVLGRDITLPHMNFLD